MQFDPRGNYLSLGCESGTIAIMDFTTKQVIRLFSDVSPRGGHRRFTPIRSTCNFIVVCPAHSFPILVDLSKEEAATATGIARNDDDEQSRVKRARRDHRPAGHRMNSGMWSSPRFVVEPDHPVSLEARPAKEGGGREREKRGKEDDAQRDLTCLAAFSHPASPADPVWLLCSYPDGSLSACHAADVHKMEFTTYAPPKGGLVRALEFQQRGSLALVALSDRTIRMIDVTNMTQLHALYNGVEPVHWSRCIFTSDGFTVLAAPAKNTNQVHTWNQLGEPQQILELTGPKQPIHDLARNVLLTLVTGGHIHEWGRPPTVHWSSYGTGFTDIEEDTVWMEPEDFFDEPHPVLQRVKTARAEAEIDIVGDPDHPNKDDDDEGSVAPSIPPISGDPTWCAKTPDIFKFKFKFKFKFCVYAAPLPPRGSEPEEFLRPFVDPAIISGSVADTPEPFFHEVKYDDLLAGPEQNPFYIPLHQLAEPAQPRAPPHATTAAAAQAATPHPHHQTADPAADPDVDLESEDGPTVPAWATAAPLPQ
ncbi:putative COMPASS component SWD1 [Paratrimastix pyriformis]|uniref:COMPASS component SWD1 n=1 Tax=Paratrimastix pyriformis TaxID=342808 RepID=A0ABQ8UPU0_9EUKA|nr:putative COMPASS component SWD1 [Paratrimastix pyriformis]